MLYISPQGEKHIKHELIQRAHFIRGITLWPLANLCRATFFRMSGKFLLFLENVGYGGLFRYFINFERIECTR